jgi:Putative 2OG-Fe(II) oxygenase/Tetratricopeptide repeat
MRWIEKPRSKPIRAEVLVKLLEKAGGRASERPDWHIDCARMHAVQGNYASAVESYEAAVRLDAEAFRYWANLADAYCQLESFDAALDACDRSDSDAPDILCERGRVLGKLGRRDEAREVLLSALRTKGAESALHTLLRMFAVDEDGTRLLEICDGLAPRYADTAMARAYRAIALSRLGRTQDALEIMNIERYMVRTPFAPPAALGPLENFNRILAEEILGDPSPFSPRRGDLELNWTPRIRNSPRLAALYDFIRAEMLRYLDDMPARGLASIMAPRPDAALFDTFNVVLRNDGSNGEHIHALSHISAVYHVAVPDSVAQAADDRGALALGCCGSHTNGYSPCWKVHHIKPVAGWLTLFPAHFFHDVVPTHTSAPRISVAADLKPIRD